MLFLLLWEMLENFLGQQSELTLVEMGNVVLVVVFAGVNG